MPIYIWVALLTSWVVGLTVALCSVASDNRQSNENLRALNQRLQELEDERNRY